MERRRLAIGVGGTVVLLASLDAYVIVSVLTDMIKDLELPVNRPERFTPVITGFLLGYVAAMPLLGQLSDRFGRRLVLQLCLAAFAVGSVLTAVADELWPLVAGRVVQGIAGGALLPITMALAGDLWEERRRPIVLGAVGAAQELGSVLGPLYGAGVAALIGWRGIFWINIPLAVLAMVAVQVSVPSSRGAIRAGVDWVGGLLLAAGLGLLVAGTYNPEPGKSAFPSWGLPCLIAGAVALVAFGLWETRSRTRLLDLSGARKGPVFAVLTISLLSGAALMVTLVDVELVAQTLLGKSSGEAALVLARFLVALALAAAGGGLVAHRFGDRWPLFAGMALAAIGYFLIANWPLALAGASYGPLPRMDTDLVITGLGLGLVIAPVSSAVLRLVPTGQHGVASSSVVVARMMGMLLGISALSAFGFHRYVSLTSKLVPPFPPLDDPVKQKQAVDAFKLGLKEALHTEYSEIFLITAVLCALGALLALTISDKPTQEAPKRLNDSIPDMTTRS